MTTANIANQQETLGIVKSIVEEMLQERFSPDDITFTEIKVETRTSGYTGEDYIDVRTFYTGNHDVLDPAWTVTLPRIIAEEMENRGLVVYRVPHTSFINQEEWDEIKDWNYWDEID